MYIYNKDKQKSEKCKNYIQSHIWCQFYMLIKYQMRFCLVVFMISQQYHDGGFLKLWWNYYHIDVSTSYIPKFLCLSYKCKLKPQVRSLDGVHAIAGNAHLKKPVYYIYIYIYILTEIVYFILYFRNHTLNKNK